MAEAIPLDSMTFKQRIRLVGEQVAKGNKVEIEDEYIYIIYKGSE